MKSHCIVLSVALALLTTMAFGQSDGQKSAEKQKTPDNPLSGFTKYVYAATKNILLTSADKVPAENYSFRPTDQVRSFGQIVGHVADAQYLFCSVVLSEKNPSRRSSRPKPRRPS